MIKEVVREYPKNKESKSKRGVSIMDFDIQSITWDDERRKNRAKLIAQEISKSIHIEKQYTALEFGCGTGLISF